MARPLSTWAAAILAAASALVLTAAAPHRPDLVVMQVNLCNSGISACFTDRSVGRAAELVRAYLPDVVTLNEICREDVATLAAVYPAGTVASAFQSAPDRRTGRATVCRNGHQFGIGLIVRLTRTPVRPVIDGGIYPMQDLSDPEIRAWLCVSAAFVACTTHLASTSGLIAREQCRGLLAETVPRARGGSTAIVAGDLNLREADMRWCVPRGYPRTGDRDVQYVLAAGGAAVVARRVVDMRGTTDHPALLVVVRPRAGSPNPPSMG